MHRLDRDKIPPADEKTPIFGCFERAGRIFSRLWEQAAVWWAWLRCLWVVARRCLQKTRMQFDWEKFQQSLKTLQFQRSEFKV